MRCCVVRDPVRRFVSGYTNRVLYHKCMGISLDQFLDHYEELLATDGSLARHFQPQHWFYGKDLNIFTHIYKLEEIDGFRQTLEEMYDTKLPKLHLQRSGDIPSCHLSDEQLGRIKAIVQEDIDIFGRMNL